jgi:hypothetical protein
VYVVTGLGQTDAHQIGVEISDEVSGAHLVLIKASASFLVARCTH